MTVEEIVQDLSPWIIELLADFAVTFRFLGFTATQPTFHSSSAWAAYKMDMQSSGAAPKEVRLQLMAIGSEAQGRPDQIQFWATLYALEEGKALASWQSEWIGRDNQSDLNKVYASFEEGWPGFIHNAGIEAVKYAHGGRPELGKRARRKSRNI